jgi:general secretion pathway protein G
MMAAMQLYRLVMSNHRRTSRNGAPPRAEAGFTLLELLVVLGILALLAAIGYPQVLRYMGTARSETARAQMSAIATSLELYALDNGKFPPQQSGLTALVQAPPGARSWRGPYLKRAEGLVDPWGHPYQYRTPGRSAPFELVTLGRDNAPGGSGEDQDIIHQ